MKKYTLLFICLVLLGTAMLPGCYRSTPPTVEAIQSQLDKDYRNIQTIAKYLENSGFSNVYITDASGMMTADLCAEKIGDEGVLSAIKQVLSENNYHKICKIGNTIYCLQWVGVQDIGCGIAYSINGEDLPEVQHMTELVPLTYDDWYYYVADYNLWESRYS